MAAAPEERWDLSSWLIHFVHRGNPDNQLWNEDERIFLPYLDREGSREQFELWDAKDRQAPLEDDAYEISVIRKILDDGHIRASWSIRDGKPTIYGPRAAVCMTEMPLGALLHYVQSREDPGAVSHYGIALPRSEVFARGGRHAIYGLSSPHRAKSSAYSWPRFLDNSCGLAPFEQYRYVSTKLDGARRIDWTHEREWRYPLQEDADVPGLPIWLAEHEPFSAAIVIVKDQEEANDILDRLRRMSDSGCDDYDTAHYETAAILGTRVLSWEALADIAEVGKQPIVRLEDIPLLTLQAPSAPVPSSALVCEVKQVLAEARGAAIAAVASWSESKTDVFGGGWLLMDSPRTEVGQALIQLGVARAFSVGYQIDILNGVCRTGLLEERECAIEAALRVLTKRYPEVFWFRRSWLD